MRLYRVGARDDFEEHQGYEYFSSKREALKYVKNFNEYAPLCAMPIEVEETTFEMTKKGIIGLLTEWASHPDNG